MPLVSVESCDSDRWTTSRRTECGRELVLGGELDSINEFRVGEEGERWILRGGLTVLCPEGFFYRLFGFWVGVGWWFFSALYGGVTLVRCPGANGCGKYVLTKGGQYWV